MMDENEEALKKLKEQNEKRTREQIYQEQMEEAGFIMHYQGWIEAQDHEDACGDR